MDTNGFYGDTFSSGFGDFYTAKKRDLSEVYGRDSPFSDPENVHYKDVRNNTNSGDI